MSFYLRFEGVNLESFIYDAEDLSVSRGGSLALLYAPDMVLEALRKEFDVAAVTPVNLGASSGIYLVEAGVEKDAVKCVRDVLASNDVCQHATFVIDTAAKREDQPFPKVRAELMAKNRWQQMQTQSVIYPEIPVAPVNDVLGNPHRVCQLDQVRPAVKAIDHWASEGKVPTTEIRSASSHARHEFGSWLKKRQFFVREIDRAYAEPQVPPIAFERHRLEELYYVNDLSQLVALNRAESDSGNPIPEPLREKIALIYLDGNGFGKKFSDTCQTPQEQGRESEQLRNEQARFLTNLLGEIASNPIGWFGETGNPDPRQNPEHKKVSGVRLEVLLWGGDEICLVVPAWKGLFTVNFFLSQTKQWKTFPHLSHSIGLVFCNKKCHIHRTRWLAKDLAELGKDELKRPPVETWVPPETDLVAYQVLESFDYLSGTPDWQYACQTYPFLSKHGPNTLLLPGQKLEEIDKQIRALKKEMPRRQLHEVVQELMRTGVLPASAKETLRDLSGDAFVLLQKSCAPKPLTSDDDKNLGERAAWFHLRELWDYAGIE